jgi:formylglycine-generating enzyme required for sulfatase activity
MNLSRDNYQPLTFAFETPQIEVIRSESIGEPPKLAIAKTASQAKYFIENLGNEIALDLVYVPGGKFLMGSPDRDFAEFIDRVQVTLRCTPAQIAELRANYDERPQHQVEIPPLYVSKYPITQSQYRAITGTNPAYFPGDLRPVDSVSWHDARLFCDKLATLTNKAYRLPSEAEWEYACRAGTNTPFYCGETILPEFANYKSTYPYGVANADLDRQATTDVGMFPPNAFGLYDFHGNVLEWCLDTWHPTYQGAPNDGRAWVDSDDNCHLLRGGSWAVGAWACRSCGRYREPSDNRFPYLGFRVVLPGADELADDW